MANLESTVDGIERAITANGIYCRNCTSVLNPTTMEPQCTKYRIATNALIVRVNGTVKQGSTVAGFCSNARAPDGYCTPAGLGYLLRVMPVSVPDAPKHR